MAYEMDCDYELAGQIIVFTSVISVVTIFTSIYFSRMFGII